MRKTDRARAAKTRRRYGLLFCGIGIDRPLDASLRTVQALKDSDVVYYMHGDGGRLNEFFGAFCRDVRTYSGPDFEAMTDEDKIACVGKDVCRELRKGRKVAYVTYGHPALCSDGFNMAAYCRSRGYVGRFVAASSSADNILAALSEKIDLSMFNHGYLVCLADHYLDFGYRRPRCALILLGLDRLARDERFEKLCARLKKEYPESHPAYGMKCADGLGQESILSGRVGNLLEWRGRLVHMMSLILPGLKTAQG